MQKNQLLKMLLLLLAVIFYRCYLFSLFIQTQITLIVSWHLVTDCLTLLKTNFTKAVISLLVS